MLALTRRALMIFIVMLVTMMTMTATPAFAAQNDQVKGLATFDTQRCPGNLDLKPQADGWGLDGCLILVTVEDSHQTASGVYKEYGTERFEGSVVYSEDGRAIANTRSRGTFETTYMITSKWAGEPFASFQFHGRCQHPITSGTGDFAGATGRIDIKDTIVDGVAVEFPYWGHIALAS